MLLLKNAGVLRLSTSALWQKTVQNRLIKNCFTMYQKESNTILQRPQNQTTESWGSQSSEEIGVPATSNAGFSHSSIAQGAKINTVRYLGIAADEPERIARHTKDGFMLPLVEIGWDEAYCRKWCEENDLLSPIYTTATRGGAGSVTTSR